MAEALGINYYHQLCETVGKEDYFDGDYRVSANVGVSTHIPHFLDKRNLAG
ncbi:MAG TPA: hypothetical protein VIJ27_12385 [Mucilaginibacter sp.]